MQRITAILDEYQPILNQSELMRKAVANTPILSIRQPLYLRKLNFTAKVKSPSDPVPRSACQPCGNKWWTVCDIMITEPFTRSTANGKSFRLKSSGDTCKSEFTVYCFFCSYCLICSMSAQMSVSALASINTNPHSNPSLPPTVTTAGVSTNTSTHIPPTDTLLRFWKRCRVPLLIVKPKPVGSGS